MVITPETMNRSRGPDEVARLCRRFGEDSEICREGRAEVARYEETRARDLAAANRRAAEIEARREAERAKRRAEERAAMVAEVKSAFFTANPGATPADWNALGDRLIERKMIERTENAMDDEKAALRRSGRYSF